MGGGCGGIDAVARGAFGIGAWCLEHHSPLREGSKWGVCDAIVRSYVVCLALVVVFGAPQSSARRKQLGLCVRWD